MDRLIDFFIHPARFESERKLGRARLFVRACLLTSLFSNTYMLSSLYFEYDKGVYLMLFNVVGFLLLALLTKTKTPQLLLGHLYVFVGAFAVIVLSYYSGGVKSAIYPWIISIPILALLVVNKTAGFIWGAIAFAAMVVIGWLNMTGYNFPVEYDSSQEGLWILIILPGLLLIIFFVSFVFENMHTRSLKELEASNDRLKNQKETIFSQSERLEKVIDEKDYIIRILAHDLRGPLNNINSLVTLMKLDTEKGKSEEYQNMILNASDNAKNLVNRVLEMDSFDEKDKKLKLEKVLVDDYIMQAIHSLKDAALAKEISIDFNNMANAEVYADDTYFGLIFENLLSNAIKFSPTQSTVKVNTEIQDDHAIVKIVDSGPGIAAEEEHKLFKKFSKLSTRPTAGESSTGLGLALVKRYVELINGKVWYEDAEGGGAIFKVKLPLA